ncbi:MAG: ABC transporter permease [Vicinamibacterales bacterium]
MFLQDVRFAWRALSKTPAFMAIAVGCLALGIGINVAIFSVVDGVLLKPYPYADGDRIVVLNGRNQRLGISRGLMSYPDYRDATEQARTLASAAAFSWRSLTISDGTSEPERYVGATINWNLFELLGTPPVLGRNFTPEDDRPGAEPVVILGHEVWQNRYSGDRSIVGRAISINGKPHTVIGVMPPRFAFPETQRLWVTLRPYVETTPREARSLQVFAKMKPGVTLEQVREELAAVSGRLAAEYPAVNREWSIGVRELKDWMLPDQPKLIILSMMGAVTLVLLIACANVANLLLARASVRHREISIRSALGAGRWRIVRELLTEAVVIGLCSVPLGVLVAWGGLKLLDQSIPTDSIPYFIHWTLDGRALAYCVALSMLTGVLFGAAPAFQATGTSLQESLREGGRGSAGERRAWLRNSLVVAEVALALILLIGSSLFVRSFLNLQGAQVGFDTAPLLTLRFYLPGEAYEPADAKARRIDDIVRRAETVPGVRAVFASNLVPLGGGGGGGDVIVEGKPAEPGQEQGISWITTTPHLRQTLGVALVRGRDFTDTEGATRSPVALINETMARRVWDEDDPLGRRFRLKREGVPEWFTVIGVVADFRHYQGDGDPIEPAAYVPLPFDPALNTGLTARVASGDPTSVAAALREQIRLSDASLPIFQVSSMEDLRQRSFWQYRLFGIMFGLFGAIALVLASIGVYGVLSYSVSQRTQEIGVRVALGAGRRDVLRLIVGQGLKLAAVGILLGVAGAALVTPAVRSVLYNVTPTDPLSFTGVAVFLVLVSFTASYIPARRAMAVDPLVAIRND